MKLSNEYDMSAIEDQDIKSNNIETMLDVMPLYGFVNNKGQLDDSPEYQFDQDELLDDDEKPEQVGREGESELGFAYDDFQHHFEGMIDGESFSNVSDDEILDLPEENRREAAGALFAASYAIFRNEILEQGYPADHASFKQNIDSQEQRERFLEEGAVEIQGEVMGPWGYDHDKMNEVMDAEIALKVYNDVAEEIL